MEQKSVLNQALHLIQGQRRHRRWLRVMTGMAAVVVFVTTYMLILPAITMEHGIFEVTATPSEAALGETIDTEIYAEAEDGREETFFVLSADGDNAGLDESQFDFDEDGTAVIEDVDGQLIEIHREYNESGVTTYWFVLEKGQSFNFSLPWINGMDCYRTEEIEEKVPVEPDIPTESVPTETEPPMETEPPAETEPPVETEPPAETTPPVEVETSDVEENDDEIDSAYTIASLSRNDRPVLVRATFSNADADWDIEDEPELPNKNDNDFEESSIPEYEENGDNIETGIIYRTEIVLDQKGKPEQEGFVDISCGIGGTLKEAMMQVSDTVVLTWKEEVLDKEYFCEFEEHTHDTTVCYDEAGALICDKEEHIHTEECLLPVEQPEYLCGLDEHVHDPVACYDEAGVLICGKGEHSHTKNCLRQEPGIYCYEDESISVIARTEYPDAFPEDAEFKVIPVTAVVDGYNYDAYMQALNGSYEIERYSEANTRLYDIAFLTRTSEGDVVECQPSKGTVTIQFSFKQSKISRMSAEENGTIEVIHLPLIDEVRQQTPTTAEATEISAADVRAEGISASVSEETVKFSLDSFSLVAFIEKEDGTVQVIDKVEPGIGYTYKDILGNALNFGLTAQKIDKIAHMDTTLAASHVKSDGGNITAGAYTGQTGSPILIGSIAGSLKIDGQKCTVYTTSEAAKSITLQNGSIFSYTTENDIRNQVTDMISHAEAVSEEMATQRSYQVMKYGWYWNGKETVQGWYEDQNEKEFDISGLPDGTYYINGDSFLKKDDVRIKKNSGQTIVFNLSEETVNLKRFNITDVDTGKSASSATSDASIASFAQTVVFNMPNAAKVDITSGILGVLIAPKAEVSIGSTSSGWIVADEIKNPGGEWHFVYQGIKDKEPLEVSIEVQKTLDGETPDRDTKFSFQLEKWENTQWVNKSTVQNFEGVVLFRETFNNAGTYWFRISEVDGGGEYQYDSTRYVVKAEVTELQNDGSPILKASLTYYKADNVNETSDENKVMELVFHNETGTPGYVLPETGGPGISLFTTGGLALMALAGLMYLILRRKGAETP